MLIAELMSSTLSELLHHNQQPGLPLPNVLRLLLDVARGLQYLHGMSVVHRGECWAGGRGGRPRGEG